MMRMSFLHRHHLSAAMFNPAKHLSSIKFLTCGSWSRIQNQARSHQIPSRLQATTVWLILNTRQHETVTYS